MRSARSLAVCAALAMAVAPVAAAAAPAPGTPTRAVLEGVLGYEGGVPPPFHPSAGTVVVTRPRMPVVLVHRVGRSGLFRLRLAAGRYRVTGCGPGGSPLCGTPRTVVLRPGEVDFVRLVWARVP